MTARGEEALLRKCEWLRMRRRLIDGRPADGGGEAYSAWHATYVATDKLDPLPECAPGTALWRTMLERLGSSP